MNIALQRLMDKENINQRQLAERVGMQRHLISDYINEKFTPSLRFWLNAQHVFHIPDDEMWKVIKDCTIATRRNK